MSIPPASVTTWNINSVRLRAPIVRRLLEAQAPDVLCLQEIKCLEDQFPYEAFADLGYDHVAVNGYKGYHGVAILSRHPFAEVSRRDFCGLQDGRYVAVRFADDAGHALAGTWTHNFYVPAGGDVADRDENPKFGHKLDFMAELTAAHDGSAPRSILVGDLNIAPEEHDVWSHRQLLKVVSHTPVEVEAMRAAIAAGGWQDVGRRLVGPDAKLYTWWSYRARDWRAANKGRRLDHVWVTPDLADRIASYHVLREARSWDKPSDHVPVTVRLKANSAPS